MKTYATKTTKGVTQDAESLLHEAQWLERLSDGQMFSKEFKRHYPDRSNQQVSMLWGLLANSIVKEWKDRGWDLKQFLPGAKHIPDHIELDKNVVMTLLYSCCCERDEDGEKITISVMDSKQASTFFERCRNFIAQEPWCVVVPDPNVFWRSL